jgi:hypothetical protein
VNLAMELRPALLLIASLACSTPAPRPVLTLEEPVQLGMVAGHFRCAFDRWPVSLAELEQHTARLNDDAAPEEPRYVVEWRGLELPHGAPTPSDPFLVQARDRDWREVSVEKRACATLDFRILVQDAR